MKPVFIHISKNAGTSIVSTAGETITNAGHRTAASWVAEYGADAPLFSVIRHPYDRVLSEYHYRRRRWNSGENNPHLMNLDLSFDDWVIATYEGDQYRTRSFFERTGVPYNRHNLVGDVLIWFISQVEWLGDADQQLLVEELLRFEHLREDWSTFSARHGIERALVHANSSPRPSDAEQRIAQRTRDIIHRYYRADFERFDFRP